MWKIISRIRLKKFSAASLRPDNIARVVQTKLAKNTAPNISAIWKLVLNTVEIVKNFNCHFLSPRFSISLTNVTPLVTFLLSPMSSPAEDPAWAHFFCLPTCRCHGQASSQISEATFKIHILSTATFEAAHIYIHW